MLIISVISIILTQNLLILNNFNNERNVMKFGYLLVLQTRFAFSWILIFKFLKFFQ